MISLPFFVGAWLVRALLVIARSAATRQSIYSSAARFATRFLPLSLALVTLASCTREPDAIKLGHYGSLTGKDAAFGVATRKGVLLAIEEINAKGGVLGRPLAYLVEDIQSKQGESATAVKKLISRDKVVAVIGANASINSLEAAPLCQKAQIPMMAISSTNPRVTEVGDYIFRICFIDPFQGAVLSKFSHTTLKAKRIALLTAVNSPYSVGLSAVLRQDFTARGGVIIGEQKYNEGEKDFRAQLTALRPLKPDVIAVTGFYTEAALICLQARSLGIDVPFIGGDSGWHVGWQFIEKPNSRGPWNDEKLCRPETTGLWHLPAIANIAAGPSGLTHYSGVGLPDSYKGTFFLADFRGGPGSVIHMIQMKPKGATFEVTKRDQLATGFLVTDVEMGNDGSIYALDWVQGWNKTGKGRIYKFTETNYTDVTLVTQTKTLIAEGMDKRPASELVKLLGHADQRVRQEAQFSLVDKKAKKELTAALAGDQTLPRLHAIWGIGMLSRKDNAAVAPLVALLKDKDLEVRAQAAKVLGDAKFAKATDALIATVKDSDAPRAQFFAAIALGKIGDKKALPAVLEMVRAAQDQDAYLRHAAVSALVGIAGDAKTLSQIGKDESSAVRTVALVAMRRKGYAEISQFLTDREPRLVTEAARAINDEQITGAMPALAKLLDAKEAKPLARRSLAANLRGGSADNAKAVVRYAMADSAIDTVRVEALQHIANWNKPSGRDAVSGLWRPIGDRDGSAAADAIRPVINDLLKSGAPQVQVAAAQAAEAHKIKEAGPALFALATTAGGDPQARVAALKALAAIGDDKAGEAVELAGKDANEAVRKAATTLAAASGKGDATTALVAILGKGSVGEQQNALTALGNLPEGKADDILAQWLEKLVAGSLKPELALDLLEAAGKRKAAKVAGLVKKYEEGLPKTDELAKYRWALAGGNAAEGKKVFWEKAEASCLRCHKVNGEGGEVGPDLGKIASVKPHEYLLESITYPNKQIAQGFETVVVTLKNGQVYAGIMKRETDTELEINSPEDGPVKVKKADIKERERGPSAMPEGLADVIGRRDLRDVVEYLSTLK